MEFTLWQCEPAEIVNAQNFQFMFIHFFFFNFIIFAVFN